MNIYFQAVQTALFYKKGLFKMLKSNFNMFLDLSELCGPNKNQSFKHLTVDMWSQIIEKVASLGCWKF